MGGAMARRAAPTATTSGRDPAVSVARRRIEAEHRRLAELKQAVLRSEDPGRLAALLGELAALLEQHFTGEEGPEGLHRIVADGARHRLPDLQRLFEEHRVFTASLADLRARAAALAAGPVRALHQEVGALVEALRAHEQTEDELFGEAFYTDIGGRA